MRNLDWLYDTDEPFRNAVCGAAAEWLGSTSTNFAGTWLEERHHEEDEACLLGQHAEPEEVDSREKLEANIREGSMMTIENDVQFVHAPFKSVQRWLDRQAAITAREISNDIAIVEIGDAKLMNEGITVFGMSLDEINLFRKSKSEQSMMISELELIAEKYREDAIAAQDEIEYLKLECDGWEEAWESMKSERDGLKRERAEMDDELDAVEKERDAYREMCGRMRKMANEMLVMEVAEC